MINPLVGRRLKPTKAGKLRTPRKPGDYCGPIVGYTGELPAVFFLKPNARDADVPARARSIGHVTSPPHVFTEKNDGTLTITASISNLVAGDTTGESDDGWHRFLTGGIWHLA